jgi:hypothetical protein
MSAVTPIATELLRRSEWRDVPEAVIIRLKGYRHFYGD